MAAEPFPFVPRNDAPSPAPGWWRRAVVYQVYIRSFADGDGDGIGDLAGIRARIPYLRDLGVDAVWITPWYPSPMNDGGYDVADYRGIEPLFGTLAEADALVAEAHAAGVRVLIDLVPNHTSSEHAWFREALAAPPGSPARARYIFRDGRGPGGAEAPNNWTSVFGGPGWTRVVEADGRPGQWYLHIFDPTQPDLDWENPEVAAEFTDVLRFWFDRGIDGFRIDVAHGLSKDQTFRDLPPVPADVPPTPYAVEAEDHPHWDRPEVHAIHASWRRVADAYDPPRVLMGEVGVDRPERLARYLRPTQLHTAFNFPFMAAPWEAAAIARVVNDTLAMHGTVGAAPTWVLDNHDATRAVTRLGRPYSGLRRRELDDVQEADLALGRRRARAAALLMLALPGSAYVYQGEELGLEEVEDLPEDLLRDPIWRLSGRTVRGRDGCRVPLPWSGDAPPFGFGPAGSRPWLPQPDGWRALTAEAQAGDPSSMLELYRAALRIRRTDPGFAGESFRWVPSPERTLHFEREGFVRCAVNLSDAPMPLPARRRDLLASVPPEGATLPPDATAWYEALPG